MKIEFNIIEIPKLTGKSYEIDSYTEGTITFSCKSESLETLEGILLVEFAMALSSWLNDSNDVDMYYESQDFEESPLILFHRDNLNKFVVTSALVEGELKVNEEDLISGSKKFIQELQENLMANHSIDISGHISQGQEHGRFHLPPEIRNRRD